MKLLITIILVSAFIYQVYAQQTCQADYECGTIPYGYCKGGVDECKTTLSGVGFDESSNLIYYGVSCRPDPYINYPFTNATIRRVSADGGVPSSVFTVFNVPAAGNIVKVYTVVNQNIYLERALREPGSAVSYYNLQTRQEKNVNPSPGFYQYYLDIAGGASYTCQAEFSDGYSYNIYRYTGALGQTSTNGMRLYNVNGNSTSNSGYCGPVRRGSGNDLIFTRYTNILNDGTISSTITTFFKGTIRGSTTLPPPLFSVNSLVVDFDVDNNGAIVYGSSVGLFRRDQSGQITTLNNEPIIGVVVYGDKVFYNNGATIKSETIYGRVQQTIVKPTTGRCECRPGFSGANCQYCSGQIQFNNGVPSCVPVDENGVPEKCSQDYQCGNVPYAFCEYSASCKCRPNFTGPKCDKCASPRTVTFRNNIPFCE